MPFTLSHVAAVLPLRKHCSRDLFAAAVIGSMMPDLPYFLPGLRMNWPIPSHQLISLPLFCLPLGWLLWLLWRPCWNSIDEEALPPCAAPPSDGRVLAALAAGTLSHLAWDACTHASYGLGRWWPALGYPLFQIGDAMISCAFVLQYASSIGGLLLLAIVAWPTRQRVWQSIRRGSQMQGLFTAGLFIAVTATWVTLVVSWQADGGVNQFRHLIRLTAWNGMASLLPIIILYPLFWRLKYRHRIGA